MVGKLKRISVEVDFSTAQKRRSFKQAIKNLSGQLIGCVSILINYYSSNNTSRYRRFLVFISTHSTPDDGWFWVQPAPNEGSMSPSKVSIILFCWYIMYNSRQVF